MPVETTRLDDCAGVHFDLLKIDVQGAELMVFANGRQRLAEAVAVQTEVSFVPLYKDQPSFGAVDTELREQGFIPHAMTALKRWPIAPTVFDGIRVCPEIRSSRPTSCTCAISAGPTR